MAIAKLIYHYLYQWQTLLGALLALLGALWTVKKIRDQIKQTGDINEATRKRDEFAARAVLPLALSELTGYALRCIRLLKLHSVGTVHSGVEVPSPDKEVIGVLQQCARHAQEDIAGQIWTLLSKLQVQQSRLRELFPARSGEELTEREFIENTLDAADIYAKTAELYAYARDESGMRKRAPVERLLSALHNSGYYDAHEHPAVQYLEQQAAEDELAGQ